MTNKQLLNKARKAYEERKAEINKDLHDYNYWELYMRYALCEWLEELMCSHEEDYEELIEYLKSKNNPLDWLFQVMQKRESNLWDEISDVMDYQMKYEKEH